MRRLGESLRENKIVTALDLFGIRSSEPCWTLLVRFSFILYSVSNLFLGSFDSTSNHSSWPGGLRARPFPHSGPFIPKSQVNAEPCWIEFMVLWFYIDLTKSSLKLARIHWHRLKILKNSGSLCVAWSQSKNFRCRRMASLMRKFSFLHGFSTQLVIRAPTRFVSSGSKATISATMWRRKCSNSFLFFHSNDLLCEMVAGPSRRFQTRSPANSFWRRDELTGMGTLCDSNPFLKVDRYEIRPAAVDHKMFPCYSKINFESHRITLLQLIDAKGQPGGKIRFLHAFRSSFCSQEARPGDAYHSVRCLIVISDCNKASSRRKWSVLS